MLSFDRQETDRDNSRASFTPVEQPGSLIRTEANFLRFPLFALHTKGLRNFDGIECQGRIRREGQFREYMLRITRNTASLYPGPLSRRIHFALLSIATERGVPLQNPITWKWRDLCKRMGIAYGGSTTLQQLKTAIRSTHGIVLHTHEALFSRDEKRALPSIERGYHLYESFAFKNEPTADGDVADTNAVWFADWYLANLNALHSAPLDYGLWQTLDQKSPIASRLYEFLFLNFHSNSPVLRYDYRNLAPLLPIKAEEFLSAAKKQLSPALELLQGCGVLGEVTWDEGKADQLQLQFRRGPKLYAGIPKANRPVLIPADREEEIHVQELRNTRPPEWFLVRDFHRLLTGDVDSLVKPSPKELSLAEELIEKHGQSKLQTLMPMLVKRLKTQWPQAKTFGASAYYLPEAIRDLERRKHRVEQDQNEVAQEVVDDSKRTADMTDRAARKALWDRMPEVEREEIRQKVLANQPPVLLKHPSIIERFCLEELAKREQMVTP